MACWNSADLCAVRFSLLDSDGSPLCDEPDGTVYSTSPVSLAINPTQDAGETVTNRNGCGDICFTRSTSPTATGADLTLTLCNFDPEFIALAIGAEVITANGQPGWMKGVSSGPAVEAHFWTKSYDGSAQNAAPNSYWHHCLPHVEWTLAPYTLGENLLQFTMNGKATESASIGTGGFSDIPTHVDPFFVGAWTAADIPDPDVSPYNQNALACGFIDTPNCASS